MSLNSDHTENWREMLSFSAEHGLLGRESRSDHIDGCAEQLIFQPHYPKLLSQLGQSVDWMWFHLYVCMGAFMQHFLPEGFQRESLSI